MRSTGHRSTMVLALVIVVAVCAPLAHGTANASTWGWNTVGDPPPSTDSQIVSVRVRVEAGLTVSPDEVAGVVSQILGDDRSWTATEELVFQMVADTNDPDTNDPDLLVTIASPSTTDELCLPLNTVGKLSCRRGGQIILNVDRWNRGPDVYHDSYDGQLDEYRRYLVNHEVGHFLGKGHVTPAACTPFTRAPVMMQQTFGLKGCAINGWPTLDNTSTLAEYVPSLAAASRRGRFISDALRLSNNPLRRVHRMTP